jgi:DNA invertase Pin-like site-specific DNA recombinase
MSKLMLQMIGIFAEFERSLIRERQREGIAAAQKAGKRFGRKKALSDDQVADIRLKLACGEAKSLVAAEYDISYDTLFRSCELKIKWHYSK